MNHSVIVLFGGRSDERQVSVASAQNIVRTLPGVLAWFWAPNGAVHGVAPGELLAHQRPFEIDFTPARPALFPTLERALDELSVENPLFLLALHGGEGEDGTVQGMLERRAIPFTGSGSEASANAFDKERAKQALRGRVRTAESRVARNATEVRAAIDDLLTRHERIVLKPLAAGSSRGLFFLGRNDDREATAAKVIALGIPYILEQFLRGRELTVGVADRGDGPAALPVIEIEVDPNRTFDYEGKYLGAGTREICPADIPEDLAAEAQASALTAHLGLGCEGYSRSDLIAAEDGVYFLELNTLPGLTTSSLVPQELAAIGIGFREFLQSQVDLASRTRQGFS